MGRKAGAAVDTLHFKRAEKGFRQLGKPVRSNRFLMAAIGRHQAGNAASLGH
jgi:hypothetical protein